MYNFVVHSNDTLCRKSRRLGLDHVLNMTAKILLVTEFPHKFHQLYYSLLMDMPEILAVLEFDFHSETDLQCLTYLPPFLTR